MLQTKDAGFLSISNIYLENGLQSKNRLRKQKQTLNYRIVSFISSSQFCEFIHLN